MTTPASGILSSLPAPTIALTTVFTPPPDCETTWATAGSTNGVVVAGLGIDTSCAPPSFSRYLDRSIVPLYSPGVCPFGHTADRTIAAGLQALATTSLCCLSGLSYQTTGDFQGNCGGFIETRTSIYNYDDPPISVDTFYAVDLAYTVAWASSDLSLFTPASAPLLLASQQVLQSSSGAVRTSSSSAVQTGTSEILSPGTQRTSAAPSSPTASPQTTDAASSSLTTGAQAGIGVGAAIVAIAIGGAAIWLVLVRRRRRHAQPTHSVEDEQNHASEDTFGPKAELDHGHGVAEMSAVDRPHEAYTNEANELSGAGVPQEADTNVRHELEGAYRGHELKDANVGYGNCSV